MLVLSFVLGASAYLVYHFNKEAFDHRLRAFRIYRLWPKCECCGRLCGLRLEEGRTLYPYKGNSVKDDPNRKQLLCRQCAVLHHEYWDDMWQDYYNGRM